MIQCKNENIIYKHKLSDNVGCRPPENWSALSYDNTIVENVCITRDYDVIKAPDQEHPTHVDIFIPNLKVVNMDEQRKRIDMDLTALAFWEDERIRTLDSKDAKAIQLPSVQTGSPAKVWSPFIFPRISQLKKLSYGLDPTMLEIAIVPMSSANDVAKYFHRNIVTNSTFMLCSRIDWNVMISCDFDFSKFPFDTNICQLEMKLFNVNATLHTTQTEKQTAGGFQIIMTASDPSTGRDPLLGVYKTNIIINIAMKRQLSD